MIDLHRSALALCQLPGARATPGPLASALGTPPEQLGRPLKLAQLATAVQSQSIERASPAQRWGWLREALLLPQPSRYLLALREAGGLKRLLPEVDALFGVPQLNDGPDWADVGQHQMRLVDATAARAAPLSVRCAALLHKIGKGLTPREIWPSHYRHESQGLQLMPALAARLALPPEVHELVLLAIAEVDRLHRATDVRAGAIAATLARVDAPARPERFERLLQVCAADFAATPGHADQPYPQGLRWRKALAAWQATPVWGLDEEQALMARAHAIAAALRGSAVPGPTPQADPDPNPNPDPDPDPDPSS